MTAPTQPPFLRLPNAGNDPNLVALQRWALTIAPFACCYNVTGTFGTLNGTTSVAGYSTLTQAPNADLWGFISPTPTTIIRIPYDGLYQFYWLLVVGDAVGAGAASQMKTWLETANTSDTGLGAPVWTALTPITKRIAASETVDKTILALYTEVVFKANDSARIGASLLNTTQNFTAVTIPTAAFKLTMPIPRRPGK